MVCLRIVKDSLIYYIYMYMLASSQDTKPAIGAITLFGPVYAWRCNERHEHESRHRGSIPRNSCMLEDCQNTSLLKKNIITHGADQWSCGICSATVVDSQSQQSLLPGSPLVETQFWLLYNVCRAIMIVFAQADFDKNTMQVPRSWEFGQTPGFIPIGSKVGAIDVFSQVLSDAVSFG